MPSQLVQVSMSAWRSSLSGSLLRNRESKRLSVVRRRQRFASLPVERLERRTLPSAFPQLISIVPRQPQFTTQAQFDVKFSENVTGVDAGDFEKIASGVTVGQSLQISGRGSSYIVTASGLTGSGTLALKLINNGSIRDSSGYPLATTFTATQRTDVNSFGLTAVEAGDVNRDGRADLVVSNSGFKLLFPAGITFLAGNGNGTFKATAISSGFGVNDIALGDVNNDGRLDLASAAGASGSGGVGVLLGNGNGMFHATGQSFAAGFGSASSVDLLDLNRDGRLDLVAIGTRTDGSRLSVFFGNGDGKFGTEKVILTAPAGAGIAPREFGDFNGDGRTDLALIAAAGTNGRGTLSILLGNGDGTLAAAKNSAIDIHASTLIARDVNGDGRLDVITANAASRTVSYLSGRGNGTFAPPVDLVADAEVNTVDVSDFNGDGRLDLVSSATNGIVSLFAGNGKGTFVRAQLLSFGANASPAPLADLNGDRLPDLIALTGTAPGGLNVRLNGTASSYTGATARIGPIAGTVTTSNVVAPGAATYTFTATYSAAGAIKVSSLGNNNLLVTGPQGFSQNATFVRVNTNTNGTPRTATYSISVPAGAWKKNEEGIYTISVGTQPVQDTASHPVPSGILGRFSVSFPISLPAGTQNSSVQFASGQLRLSDSDHGDSLIASEAAGVPMIINGHAGGSNQLRLGPAAFRNLTGSSIVFHGGNGAQNTLILDTTDQQIDRTPDLTATSGQWVLNTLQTVQYSNVQRMIPTTRMYRAYNPLADVHIFTTSTAEFDVITGYGLRDETRDQEGWSVVSQSIAGTSSVFRLYNAANGEHYYTLSAGERDSLVKSGWVYEKVEGFLYTTAVPGSTPIYRLYNQVAGGHLYTESAAYRDAVVTQFPGIWVATDNLGFGFAADATNVATADNAASLALASQRLPVSSAMLSASAVPGKSAETSAIPAESVVPTVFAVAADLDAQPEPIANVLAASAQSTSALTPRSADESPTEALDLFWCLSSELLSEAMG